MFTSIYDGNVAEWDLNRPYDGKVDLETAVSYVYKLNESDNDFVGPKRHFGNEDLFVLYCAWTSGQEVWPFVVCLHTNEMTEEQLHRYLADNDLNINTDDSAEDE